MSHSTSICDRKTETRRWTYGGRAGDPVNLVDPNGHDPWWEDEPGYAGPQVHYPTAGGAGVDDYSTSGGWDSGSRAPAAPAAAPGNAAGCHSDGCSAGQDRKAAVDGMIAQLNLYFRCQAGVRGACHVLNEAETDYEQYLADLGSQLSTELAADHAANAAADQARAKAARTCDNFLCGVTQAVWGTALGIGKLVNPSESHIFDAMLQQRDNPWLGGDCTGWCWGGQAATFAATVVAGGAGAAAKVGESAGAVETLIEGAVDATDATADELVVIFKATLGETSSIEEAVTRENQLAGIVFDAKFLNGDWPIIGNLQPVQVTQPWFLSGHEAMEDRTLTNLDTSIRRRVTAEEAAKYQRMHLSYPMRLQRATAAIYGRGSWQDEHHAHFRDLAAQLTASPGGGAAD